MQQWDVQSVELSSAGACCHCSKNFRYIDTFVFCAVALLVERACTILFLRFLVRSACPRRRWFHGSAERPFFMCVLFTQPFRRTVWATKCTRTFSKSCCLRARQNKHVSVKVSVGDSTRILVSLLIKRKTENILVFYHTFLIVIRKHSRMAQLSVSSVAASLHPSLDFSTSLWGFVFAIPEEVRFRVRSFSIYFSFFPQTSCVPHPLKISNFWTTFDKIRGIKY